MVAVPPPIVQYPGIGGVVSTGVILGAAAAAPPPPPPAPPAPPAVAAGFPPRIITLLENGLLRYTNSQISYPYKIILVDIDPNIIAGRAVAGGGYPWRNIPAASPLYPVGYDEVETVLLEGTTDALMVAIVGYFAPNRNRDIREIYGQTEHFADGQALECSSSPITNNLTFMYWISNISSWDLGNGPPRFQIIRARPDNGADTPLPGGEAFSYIQTLIIDDPDPLT